MKRILTLFLGLLVLLTSTAPASACRYQAQQSREKIANAPVAFIGTVISGSGSTSNRVTFKVQKAIRGVKDGQTYEADGYISSCHNEFWAYERWLYLGSNLPSDSLRLENWVGQPMQMNIDFVIRETGLKEAEESLALKGFTESICVHDAGSGLRIVLENGIKAVMHTTPEKRVLKAQEMSEEYSEKPLDQQFNEPSPNPGIDDTFQHCMPDSGKCVAMEGTLYLGDVTEAEISGRIVLKDGEKYPAYAFRVNRAKASVSCP